MIKNLPANAGDSRNVGSIPEPGRSPGEGSAKAAFEETIEFLK